jgi:hypothetical protein
VVQAVAPLDYARPPDAGRLTRLVGRLRWRLGLERTFSWLVRGLALGAAVVIGLHVAAWLTERTLPDNVYLVALLPLLGAVALAVIRWPSASHAAKFGDRRLGLDARLGTALELVRRPRGGRFDALQLHDALTQANAVRRPVWFGNGQRTGLEAAGAAILVLLAIASLGLLTLPRPALPITGSELTDLTGDDAPDRTVASDLPEVAPLSDDALASVQQQQSPIDPDLASRLQGEQAEREALDHLSQALGKVSAAQPAAEAIQSGDFSAAKDALQSLGEEADQLSDAAKQQLARSLQQAANATTPSDKTLADRERQAAQALTRGGYNEQRQALSNLGDQVEKSGARAGNDDQVARDSGRLQQQQQQQAGNAPTGQGQLSQANSAANTGAAQQAAQQPAADGGANAQGTLGQQGGPGMGAGTGGDATGDEANRLDAAGQSVEVPQKLGAGPGVRPPDGTEDQTGNDPTAGDRSVSELVQAQQTGQVTPEQNLVPGEQRPVVRGYFH